MDMERVVKLVDTWVDTHIMDWPVLVQGAVSALILGACYMFWRRVRPRLEASLHRGLPRDRETPGFVETVSGLLWLGLFAAVLVLVEQVSDHLGHDTHLMKIFSTLAVAWVVIRLATSFLRERFWAVSVAALVWILAAMHILGLSTHIFHVLQNIGVDIGNTRLTLYLVLKGIVVFVLVMMAATFLSRIMDHRLNSIPHLSPSHQVLVSKGMKVLFFCLAFFVAASSAGLNLSTLKIFSGAVGVGVGFGLQKIVSNLVSGMILLTDRSIKPGDTIEIDDHFGWITSLNARYVQVITRDGKEHLIPNEHLITNEVVNWSHTHPKIRLHIPVSVSYESDLKKAVELMEQVSAKVPRVLDEPAPACRVLAFGDSGVECEVRAWIKDPVQGVHNVISEILLGIWDAFHEQGIVLPYPQRDVWLRQAREEATGGFEGKTSP
jgi:small-conductance mechanosensitive channel